MSLKDAASTAYSPLMSCMGLVRRSVRHSHPLPGQRRPGQGKHKKGRVGNEEERREHEVDEGDGGGGGPPRSGGPPPCHYRRPGSAPQTDGTAATVHAAQHRAPPEPWDYVYHGALVSRIAQWDPSEGVAGGLEGRRPATGSSPSPAPPSLREGEDTAESPVS